LLQAISLRIDGIARLHHLLTRSQGQGIVNLAAYLGEIGDAATSSLTKADNQIFFDLVPDCMVSAKRAAAIGLFVGEAIMNALKHSHFAGTEATEIRIVLRNRTDNGLIIEVHDNGVGLPVGYDPQTTKSTGLHLMRAVSDQLGGRLQFEPGHNGLCVRLVLLASSRL
jgi:two-component sensor histidine kinase